MSKRKTVGERIMRKHFDATFDGECEILLASRDIDRAIRRAQVDAWDDGYFIGGGLFDDISGGSLTKNPYRGRPKL